MKNLSALILTVLFCNALYSQNDSIETKREVVIYSFFYNIVPDGFQFPLIGFVNVAKGNHQGFEMGFVNNTLKNFKGAQIGFVNTTLQEVSGFQMGFVNTTLQELSGFQMGFVNTTFKELNGFQAGFVNSTFKGLDGFQLGFVNTSREEANGFQMGFVNTAGKGIKGNQIGFVNYADTITGGIPIGIVSIVKKGGYRAVEISVNEFYPVNVSFKIGVPKLYSFFQGSYNSAFKDNFALGGGFGSLLAMGESFYFNPEASIFNPVSNNAHQRFLSLVGNFRYQFLPHFQIAVGPSVTWEYANKKYSNKKGDLYDPIYSIVNQKIDDRNRLVVGARAALSVDF